MNLQKAGVRNTNAVSTVAIPKGLANEHIVLANGNTTKVLRWCAQIVACVKHTVQSTKFEKVKKTQTVILNVGQAIMPQAQKSQQ